MDLDVSMSSPQDRGDQGDPGRPSNNEGHSGHSPRQLPKYDSGSEVFCKSIPKEMSESELHSLFTVIGPVTELRMPKSRVTGINKGYAFITFLNNDDAIKAISKLNGRQVRHRRYLKVTKSTPITRLFIGNIPKAKGRRELYNEFAKRSNGLREVIIYSSPNDDKKNRGFCFLDYESHRAAATAKRRLSARDAKVFGCDIMVDWADPEQEVDDVTMSKVQILYVRHIPAGVTEAELATLFGTFGPLDHVKKIKDFAFVHFAAREDAARAKDRLNGHKFVGIAIEIQWAKPPTTKEMRQQTLRAREKRIMVQLRMKPPRGVFNPFPLPPYGWSIDPYVSPRRDRGDNLSNNSRSKPHSAPPMLTKCHYLSPKDHLDRFRDAADPFNNWTMGYRHLPRIPPPAFILQETEDEMVAMTSFIGFHRGRNRGFGTGFLNQRNSEADEVQNWRLNTTGGSQQRGRGFTNQRARRHSEAEDRDNWRERP